MPWNRFGIRIKRIIGVWMVLTGLVLVNVFIAKGETNSSSYYPPFFPHNAPVNPSPEVTIQLGDISTTVVDTYDRSLLWAFQYKAFRNSRGTQAYYAFYPANVRGIETIYYAWSITGYTWPAEQVDLQAFTTTVTTTGRLIITAVAIAEDETNSQLIVYVMSALSPEETRLRRGVIPDEENRIIWDPTEQQLWSAGHNQKTQTICMDPQGHLWALSAYKDGPNCRILIKASQTILPSSPIAWSSTTELDSTPSIYCWTVSLVPYTTTTNIVAIGQKALDGNAWACAVTWNGGTGAPTSQGKSQDTRYYYAYGPSGNGVKDDSGLIHYALATAGTASPIKVYYHLTWAPATKTWGDRTTVYDGKDDTNSSPLLVCDTSRSPNNLYYIYEHGTGVIEYKTASSDNIAWSAATQIDDHPENSNYIAGWPVDDGHGGIFGMYQTMTTYTVRSFLLSPVPPVTTSATTTPPVTTPTITGWLAGWEYRKSHTIQGSPAGSLTNYQILLNVHYGSGVDSGNTVYLEGQCRPDFGDLRFTSSDGQTELDYWLEEKADGDYALVWVEVESIPADPGSTTMYLYYGKPDATTTSDEDTTFVFADDFEEEAIGATPDPQKWETNGTGVSDFVDIQSRKGEKALRIKNGDTSDYTLAQSKSFPVGFYSVTIYLDMATIGSAYQHNYYIRISENSTPIVSFAVFHTLTLNYYDGASYQSCGITLSLNTEYKIEIQFFNATTVKLFVNDVEKTIGYRNTPTNGIDWYNPGNAYKGEPNENYISKTYVRKIIDPEPTHGSWGSEERGEAPPITTTTSAPLTTTITETVSKPETTSPTPVTTHLTMTPSIPTVPVSPTLLVVLGLGLVAGLGGGLWVWSKRRAGPAEPVPEGPPPTELRAPVSVQEYDPDVALATLKQLATVYERVAWQTLMDEFHFTDDIDLQTLLFRAGLSGELEVKIDEMTKMVRLQVVEAAEPLMPKKFACPTCGAALEPHESNCPACGSTFPSCIICRRPVQANLTKTPCCGAYAHEPHLKEWVRIRGTCPMCREKLSDWMLP